MVGRVGRIESPATMKFTFNTEAAPQTVQLLKKTLFCGGHMPTEKMIGREQMME